MEASCKVYNISNIVGASSVTRWLRSLLFSSLRAVLRSNKASDILTVYSKLSIAYSVTLVTLDNLNNASRYRYYNTDMINWLTKLRKQLLEANGGHTEADLQRELSRKSKLLDAYLDGILNKQEYQKKAEELDERIIQLKTETEKNKANSGDIAEIDKVLANIDEEVARYVDGNEKLKVEYLLEHLEQVQIFPDKVIVIVPILSEGIVVEKTQYVSREKWRW